MNHDEQLQFVLKFLYVNRLNVNSLSLNDHTKSKWLFHTLKAALEKQDCKPGNELLQDFLAILYNDGFLDVDKGFDESIKIPADFAPMVYFTISAKGVSFVFSDTYPNRKKRDRQQLELSDSQIKLNDSQIKINDVNNKFISKQSELIDSQLKTNEISKTTNILIAVFTGAAAIWYLREVAKNILLDYYPINRGHIDRLNLYASNTLNICTIVIFCLGIIAVRYIYLKQQHTKKQMPT